MVPASLLIGSNCDGVVSSRERVDREVPLRSGRVGPVILGGGPLRRKTQEGHDQHDGEMWVSSAFGDFESNVSRWRGKFKEFPSPAVSDFSQGDIEIKLVEFEGTYNWSARMGAPVEAREGYGMVVAIVRQNIFFVVIGPKETMAKWRPSFDNMLKSVTLAK